MANRYNDQDYQRYYDRDDRYDSRSESRSFDRNRQRTGYSNYDRDRDEGYQGLNYDRDYGTNPQSGYPGGNFMSDFGRGYNQQSRDTEDFESATRPSRNYTGGFDRNTESNRDDYTLYGYNENRFGYGSGSEQDRGYYGRGGDYGYGGGSSSNYGSGSDRERTRNFDRSNASDYSRGSGYERGGSDRSSQFYQGSSGYGQSGSNYPSTERGYDYGNRGDYSNRNRSNEDRGWWEKTSDEISSWFGDEEAARRRQRDQREGYQTSHRGRGPKNYRRSDDRIREDINDRLTDYPYLDASNIEVEINNGEVTLSGTVDSRYAKRMAEDIAEDISGVSNVENRLRVQSQNSTSYGSSTETSGYSSTGIGSGSTSTGTGGMLTGGTNTGITGASSGSSTGSTSGTSYGSGTGTSATSTGSASATGTTDTSIGNTSDTNTSSTTGRARTKSA